ncbi:unnamed protein product [Lupinus luteus]|uniref:Isopenicillin N synthase-like Fe(2+) 2OG dioxygenase domain-containing protein n=1 Tax=Lupinus luteus TaxID=3873 RepID=A0AAV1WN70_LUPLU
MVSLKNGVLRFFEQDIEVKKELYTHDQMRTFIYNSNLDMYSSPALNWRDSFMCYLAPNAPKPEELPEGIFFFKSEALGLHSEYLKDIACAAGFLSLCHYYPACPEPELTMGTTKHSDCCFLTVLLQDQIGGLHALYEDNWIDMSSVPGALVVNIGDLMQACLFIVLTVLNYG